MKDVIGLIENNSDFNLVFKKLSELENFVNIKITKKIKNEVSEIIYNSFEKGVFVDDLINNLLNISNLNIIQIITIVYNEYSKLEKTKTVFLKSNEGKIFLKRIYTY